MSQYPAPPPPAPYEGTAAGPPPAPPRKGRAGKIILFVVLGLALLCCGGGAAAWFVLKDDVKKVTDAVSTEVSAPATLGGRKPSTNPELKAAATQMTNAMKVMPGVTPVSAIYGDPADRDLVMIAATKLTSLNPRGDLDSVFGQTATWMPMTQVADVDAGPLGGAARCGQGKAEGLPIAVCGWVDNGSGGLVISYFSGVAKARAEFPAIRAQIERRG